jgi:hypothetical protein
VTDWLRDPDNLVYDCVEKYGATSAAAGLYKFEDTRPWNGGDVLTAVEVDRVRLIKWTIPLKVGSKFTNSWQTKDRVHWSAQYDTELAKSPSTTHHIERTSS